MLKINTSLTMACFGFLLSIAYGHAKDNITKYQINTGDGVVQLNSRATIDNPSDIVASQVKVVNQYQSSDGFIINRPLVKLVPDATSGFTLGKEMVQFEQIVPMALSVYGRPYGNYNAGCTLCVFSSTGGMNGGSGQAAISGIDYRGGANAVTYGDMATVGFYHFDENSSARVAAQAASFGPGVVNLSSPMTNKEMSQLHVGMYLATNVIDPTIASNNQFIDPERYWGFIKSWDANHIYVYDWAVLDGGNASGGQVPNIRYLDSQLSEYKVPMIFAGVSDKVFAENEYMDASGKRVLGDQATAVANKFEREEFDFRAHDWTKPKSLVFHGWTTSFECRPNCHPKAVTEDSYAYLVNGPDGLPRAYVAQTVGEALEFSGYSTFIGGNGAPLSVDVNGNISSAVVGSNHIMSSFASALPSNNIIHMSSVVTRDMVATNDWRDYGVRLVMDVDSQRDRKKGLYGGTRMGSIAFNYKAAHYGGICLLGYDSNQGLCQEGDGSVSFAKKVTVQSEAIFQNGLSISPNYKLFFQNNKHVYAAYLFTDPNGDMNLGTQISGGASIRGVNGYYGKSAILTEKLSVPNISSDSVTVNKTFIVQGNSMFNGINMFQYIATKTLEANDHITSTKFIGTLLTPTSSSAPCTMGEFKDDTNYHYVCVATNKWKRVALSDF
ncbi:unnamed protein product [Commensalibacter communis]|nr:unnamed protein product [Commensalibacter communis]